jgi:hypothetical protein
VLASPRKEALVDDFFTPAESAIRVDFFIRRHLCFLSSAGLLLLFISYANVIFLLSLPREYLALAHERRVLVFRKKTKAAATKKARQELEKFTFR